MSNFTENKEYIIEEISKVLFPLTEMQIAYLFDKRNYYNRQDFQRGEGFTTVFIIKQLLSGKHINNDTLNYDYNTIFYKRFFIKELVKICEKFKFSEILMYYMGSVIVEVEYVPTSKNKNYTYILNLK